jgi:hypothetical protein
MSVSTYPVRVDATLDSGMSRWLWLVKWLLAIPHFFLLFFLWVAFFVVSVCAFFAILFTGRYPEGLFTFNVGVLRWTWRVSYYTYGALGTDRYPPFTLADVPEYPAHFDVDYPTRLSRGLVLVKWWLLAIPHYLVVGIFVGGGTWAVWRTTDDARGAPGLIGLLVLVAAVVLAFTGRYPRQIFDFVLGLNRWVLRVAAYAGLMTDDYPPFRLDMGEHEPAGTMTVSRSSTATEPDVVAAQPPTPSEPGRRWTAWRIVSLVTGGLLGLLSLALLTGGGIATWATNTQRDAGGYLTTDNRSFSTASYAVTSESIDLGDSTGWITPADVLGNVRIRATATTPGQAVFIGVGPQAAVDRYLAGVNHLLITDWPDGHTRNVIAAGAAPRVDPANSNVWTAQTAGPGRQSLTWRPTSGEWVAVVMNADRSPGVSITADVGAEVPDLKWIAVGLLAAGGVLLAVSVVLIVVPVVRASR